MKVFPGFVGLNGGGYSDGTGPGPFNPNGAGVGQSREQLYYGMDIIVLF